MTVWLLLSRLLHASRGLVFLGIQQTLISTTFTLSVSKSVELVVEECLSHQVESLGFIGQNALQLVNGVYLLIHWAAEHSKLVIQLT